MNRIGKHPGEGIGDGFVDSQYLPPGADEYYLRELQNPGRAYRALTPAEIELLVRNENRSDDWSRVQVGRRFDPDAVRRCVFHGLVRIGDLQRGYLEFHDLRLATGLYDSTIVSCDIGSDVVIDNVRHLAHYIVGNEVMLLSINEMLTTNHAKFGNGIVKEGEPEEVRIWLEIGNENGGRKVLPFDGLWCGDAYLWSKYRDNRELMERFTAMTQTGFDARRGYYGTVGDRSVIKYCRILKDVRIGSDAYIKGANKLKNLTINSGPGAETQIGEGVELVNGVVGPGCHVFYGVKAVRFVMGSNSSLKYGARLINSVLGDNSTISCCEVLNSLLFPGHEQHHNNSFLCAATIGGGSNLAAGATIGSNHNSRGNDGEIWAGRGFWPGLCVSLKHSSRFASFTLLAKAAYPAELDIRLPFCLVANNETLGRLELLPGYWFLYNMYALTRNAAKLAQRDRRPQREPLIEFGFLAPDTAEELLEGLRLLEEWTGRAQAESSGTSGAQAPGAVGRRLLRESPRDVDGLEIRADGVEASRRPAVVLKAAEGYAAYREMVRFYAVSTLFEFSRAQALEAEALWKRFEGSTREPWINVGGLLAPAGRVSELLRRIETGEIDRWEQVHEAYRDLGRHYPEAKAAHAFAVLREVAEAPGPERWGVLLDEASLTLRTIAARTRESRVKDFRNPFRRAVYGSQAEMDAVLGTIEGDSFVRRMDADAAAFAEWVSEAKGRGVGSLPSGS